jgi:ATP-dependent exoDNAse (exonuclease V) alpha subunit
MSSDRFNGLQNSLFVCIGATVVLTTNLWPEMGLSNGSTGFVKDIEFRGVEAGVANRIWNPNVLPYCIWVDFGDKYHGPPFFPNEQEGEEEERRRGWVPISPMTATEYIRRTNSVEETTLTRTMVPLKLAWAWTIWKVQGQTVDGKVVVSLGRKEVEHGLSYVAFSRVRRFQDIGIIGGVSGDRLTSQIAKQAKLKKRLTEDARLNLLEKQTLASLLPSTTGVY